MKITPIQCELDYTQTTQHRNEEKILIAVFVYCTVYVSDYCGQKCNTLLAVSTAELKLY